MLLILYNYITKNPNKDIDSDTLAFKLVNRGLANVLLGCLMHSYFITFHRELVVCGGILDAPISDQFVETTCWTQGLYVYANETRQTSEFWGWEYSPVKQDFYPDLPEKSNPPESIVYLSLMTKIPLVLIFSILSLLAGKFLWNKFQGNLITDLVRSLDAVTTLNRTERQLQLGQIAETLKLHQHAYTKVLWYYIRCMLFTTVILILQNLLLVATIGNNDYLFAPKVFHFSHIEYQRWPVDLVKMFPRFAYCPVTFESVTYDYMCVLPWSYSYLYMFACIYLMNIIGIVLLCGSVMYYIWFARSQKFRIGALSNILELDSDSNEYKCLTHTTPGSAFILVLLCQHVSHSDVYPILENLDLEFKPCSNKEKNM